MEDRDHFAAAALTGFTNQLRPGSVFNLTLTAKQCYELADAMLRERGASAEKCLDVRDSRTENNTDHDAAPAARAAPSVSSVPLGKGLGTGDTFWPDAYRRFAGEVMNWISEATSIYEPRSDGGRRIMAFACMKCWDAFNRIAYPTTNHDAVPAAIAPADSHAPRGAVDRESVGTDKAEPLTRDCGAGNTRDRPKPIKQDDSDRSKPISDERLAALERLSARDQELELTHGITGNPMIKAQQRTPQPQATPTQGSVHGEGTEPVAWAVENGGFEYVSLLRESAEYATLKGEFAEVVPLYRQPQPTLTDAERAAIKEASEFYIGTRTGKALGGLLERLK